MSPPWRRLLNLGLAAVLAGLLIVGLCLAWPGGGPSPAPQAKEKQTQPSGPAGDGGRDPFAPPGRQGARAAREEPLEVLGVVIGPKETLALVRHGTSIRRLRPGETVGRFRLKEARADRLILQGLDGERDREVAVKKSFPAGEARKPGPR